MRVVMPQVACSVPVLECAIVGSRWYSVGTAMVTGRATSLGMRRHEVGEG
jgi:hypothetical protein